MSFTQDQSKSGDSITHLVDFGSGQSYLSRILASPPHNLNLVAVESKASNIEAGKALDARAGLEAISQAKTLKETLDDTKQDDEKKGSILYVQHMIKDESMEEVLEALDTTKESSPDTVRMDPGLMIISLHSCGNLIHHALNALLGNDQVKAVAVAPRNWTAETSTDFFKRHFYRALLQRIFYDHNILRATEPLVIGSLRKGAYTDFYEYVTSAIKKILDAATGPDACTGVSEGVKDRIRNSGLDLITRETVADYETKYADGLKQLSVMWTLMAFCAGCVESLIVVDRWCYLMESGKCRAVRVESAFNYAVSPRNLVIVGLK
ncbi:hypothetical protein ABW21_db0209548 [Orbilia brochopaga]|nr:hypothetical protein ABW21_db0209548 [Drechslerella brochopaga]